tara:strand:- start:852 stop:1190 length:339 start_codon:yes stop_codon:yes gene_type:complete
MWKDINTAPVGKKMFVAKAFDVEISETSNKKYTSDPYCVWQEEVGVFKRWIHPFPPTHYHEISDTIELEVEDFSKCFLTPNCKGKMNHSWAESFCGTCRKEVGNDFDSRDMS